MIEEIFIYPIKIYRKLAASRAFPRCAYHPNCSEYSIMAIRKHGVAKGLLRSAWRIARCNPLSKGGVDMP